MKKRLAMFMITFLCLSSLFSPIGYANEDTGKKVVSIAKTYIGIPYQYGGTSTSGFDCSGFTSFVFDKIGINLPRTSSQQYTVGTSVSKSNLKAGDLVFFKTSGSSISHVGIYIGSNEFISATTSKGIKIASINDPYYWGSRYVGAKRVIKEERASTPVTLAQGEFADIPSSFWAYQEISALSKQGIIKGYDNGKFLPEKAITRAEAAKMLTESLNLDVSTASSNVYQDVPESHWASDYVSVATGNKFFNGYEGNIFKPDEPISRAEVATLLKRAFQLEQIGSAKIFTDLDSKYWAYNNIQILASHGIVNGYDDQTFKATKQTTRAEFSTMLYKSLNK